MAIGLVHIDCFDSTKIYYTIYMLSKFPFNLVCQTGFYKINSPTIVSGADLGGGGVQGVATPQMVRVTV